MKSPLPIRDGVTPSYVWLPAGPWLSVLEFLVQRFPHVDREAWLNRMLRGEVRDRHGYNLQPDSSYQEGMCVFYYRELEKEAPIPFEENILFRDEHLLVADKPHFLPVTPGGRFVRETLLARLKRKTGIDSLAPIHRLDRETAGVIVFSVAPASRGLYQALFRDKTVVKMYEALAPHDPALAFPFTYRSRLTRGKDFFRTEETEGEANAETVINLLERRGEVSLYELFPTTGKKHQLRVHLASLGIPILNDALYPQAQPVSDDYSKPLQLLARSIAFTDPINGEARRFKSERSLLPHPEGMSRDRERRFSRTGPDY